MRKKPESVLGKLLSDPEYAKIFLAKSFAEPLKIKLYPFWKIPKKQKPKKQEVWEYDRDLKDFVRTQ